MKTLKIFTLSVLLSLQCMGQVNHLKIEFRNLSWVMDKKAGEVISTLSKYYGNDSLKNDSSFVSQEEYLLYYDSLTLYKLTKNAYQENNSKAKSTVIGNFGPVETKHSNSEWLRIFDQETRDSYAANKNSTIGDYSCIPSTYDNLKLFYKKESECIKSYNKGRIKVYSTQACSSIDTINYYLAFHKTIKPSDNNAVSYYGEWMPYIYFYPKPKKIVYPASIKKLWESKTGLPYSVAKELQLTDDRIVKILSLPEIINEKVLIKETAIVNKKYDILVKCDTCNVKIFDSNIQDGDVVDFIYKNETKRVNLKTTDTNYELILSNDNSFYIFAVLEGNLETCTIDAIIDEKNHTFTLKKGERVLVNLLKTIQTSSVSN